MGLIICFIDDSDFEHDLVRSEIAPCTPGLNFVQAYTFEEARDLLGENIPILFLLDLWGQDPDVESPSITPKEDLERRVSEFKTLDMVYHGLDNFHGDKANEYLKRLFTIVNGWRQMFEDVCDRIGQNRKYGLTNLQQVRKFYPGVPGVFYTRKSLINDAVAISRANADGLFLKPTGRDDSETRILTRKYAPKLIKELTLIIDSKIDDIQKFESFYHTEMRPGAKEIEPIVSSWKEFINK